MAFTKITNFSYFTITIPVSIGGGTLAGETSTIVPYDIQVVASAMFSNNIKRYGLSSVDALGGNGANISANPGAAFTTATRPPATAFLPGEGIWNTDDKEYNYSDGTTWLSASNAYEGSFTTLLRPIASSIPIGHYIWNTDYEAPQFSNGASKWFDGNGIEV